QYDIQSGQDLQNIPLTAANQKQAGILVDVASIERTSEPVSINHYNIRRVVDIYASVQGRDLGAVGREVSSIVDANRKLLPRGSFVSVRGQYGTMRTSYIGLIGGLAFAIILVYLLIVVNFQSWLDPFVIITALPAALAGIILFLFITHTTLSVPALMGAIMCMGVATANSILVVSFAKIRLAEHGDPILAAIEAGATRFRPVCMTALAMIIGMVPMALGLGDGGEQNAPLGRAVIGGLLCATVATLVFVPSVFAVFHRREPNDALELLKNLQVATELARNDPGPNNPGSNNPGRPISKRAIAITAILTACTALAIVFGLHSRVTAETRLRESAQPSAIPYVDVVSPKASADGDEIALPGSTSAFNDTPIYARTSGYVKHWYVDIGARVKRGQLLATIETPELDQQLQQAKADLENAEANLQLAKITAARWQHLLETDSVSHQETDQAISDLRSKQALVNSSKANVERLEQLQAFERVSAPFDGVVTARNTDIGALVQA